MTSLDLKPGDGVDVSVLDGLVVDIERSKNKELSFNREHHHARHRGPCQRNLCPASGTARVVKVSRQDRGISLMVRWAAFTTGCDHRRQQ